MKKLLLMSALLLGVSSVSADEACLSTSEVSAFDGNASCEVFENLCEVPEDWKVVPACSLFELEEVELQERNHSIADRYKKNRALRTYYIETLTDLQNELEGKEILMEKEDSVTDGTEQTLIPTSASLRSERRLNRSRAVSHYDKRTYSARWDQYRSGVNYQKQKEAEDESKNESSEEEEELPSNVKKVYQSTELSREGSLTRESQYEVRTAQNFRSKGGRYQGPEAETLEASGEDSENRTIEAYRSNKTLERRYRGALRGGNPVDYEKIDKIREEAATETEEETE